jgi:hypothetical protein
MLRLGCRQPSAGLESRPEHLHGVEIKIELSGSGILVHTLEVCTATRNDLSLTGELSTANLSIFFSSSYILLRMPYSLYIVAGYKLSNEHISDESFCPMQVVSVILW